jgi:ribosome modulation factor
MTPTMSAKGTVQRAFEMGFRAALRGEGKAACKLDNPLYRAAWPRGHQRGMELKARNGS